MPKTTTNFLEMRTQNFKVKSTEKQPVKAVTKEAGATCTAITPSANLLKSRTDYKKNHTQQ